VKVFNNVPFKIINVAINDHNAPNEPNVLNDNNAPNDLNALNVLNAPNALKVKM